MSAPSTVTEALAYGLGLKDVADCYADRCCLLLAEKLQKMKEEQERLISPTAFAIRKVDSDFQNYPKTQNTK